MEVKEIEKEKQTIKNFAILARQNDNFTKFYDTYLNIRGYAYRLEKPEQRLYYTFSEAVSAIDMAKLMRDDESLKMNSLAYIVILDICIDEYLNIEIDEDEKQKACEFYNKFEKQKAKENKKYHMYQY